jgi:hypothetical protein
MAPWVVSRLAQPRGRRRRTSWSSATPTTTTRGAQSVYAASNTSTGDSIADGATAMLGMEDSSSHDASVWAPTIGWTGQQNLRDLWWHTGRHDGDRRERGQPGRGPCG